MPIVDVFQKCFLQVHTLCVRHKHREKHTVGLPLRICLAQAMCESCANVPVTKANRRVTTLLCALICICIMCRECTHADSTTEKIRVGVRAFAHAHALRAERPHTYSTDERQEDFQHILGICLPHKPHHLQVRRIKYRKTPQISHTLLRNFTDLTPGSTDLSERIIPYGR